jgi:hypothetical protein
MLETNSTLRELFGVYRVLCAIAPLLSGGRHKVVMDNLGCVFIMGEVVPPFATGARQLGNFVSGGSPNPDLQRLAVFILDLQYTHWFRLTSEWVPRDLNVRADFLFHTLEYSQHSYRLCEECFAHLDGLWGPHSIDRFASAEDCQPLIAPNAGRFCSRSFQPDAEWTDALTIGGPGKTTGSPPPRTRSAPPSRTCGRRAPRAP